VLQKGEAMDWNRFATWFAMLLDRMNCLLNQEWWQGVAGIAQIMAGVLALVTVWQAKRMMAQASEERELLVAPDWDYTGYDASPRTLEEWVVKMSFRNSGFGPARYLQVDLESDSPHVRLQEAGVRIPVFPEGHFTIFVVAPRNLPWTGSVSLVCFSRLGQKLEHRFSVESRPREQRNPKVTVEPERS